MSGRLRLPRPVWPWQRRAAVLLYHRIAVPGTDPWSLSVSAGHFAEHMDVLRRYATVSPLEALPDQLDRRGTPRRCVAVTFDDGYTDNLHAGVPVLERHEVPATFFVAAGAVGGPGFWWDQLASMFFGHGRSLPRRLDLVLGDERFTWDADASPGVARELSSSAESTSISSYHPLLLSLWQRLQGLPESQRGEAMGAIGRWSSHPPTNASDADVLTSAELATLASHPLVEIGGHTVTHPRLSSLSLAEQRVEIADGRQRLEEVTGRRLRSFAYPYGRSSDYTADTAAIVREEGFERACINQSGSVGARTDPFRMPRAYVRDVDGETFERQLVRWLRAPIR